MTDKNKSPKHTGKSKKDYLQRYNAERNKAIRVKRHKHKMALQATKRVLVKRGNARRLRRSDIFAFKAIQTQRKKVPKDTTRINAPSLGLVNRYL